MKTPLTLVGSSPEVPRPADGSLSLFEKFDVWLDRRTTWKKVGILSLFAIVAAATIGCVSWYGSGLYFSYFN